MGDDVKKVWTKDELLDMAALLGELVSGTVQPSPIELELALQDSAAMLREFAKMQGIVDIVKQADERFTADSREGQFGPVMNGACGVWAPTAANKSLRDDFAGQAMQARIARDPDFETSAQGAAKVANTAYAIARAMLAERARGEDAGT